MKQIKLSEIVNPESKVLSGRPEGNKARNHFALNLKDKDQNSYIVIIPENIRTFSTSYFLGLFSESIKDLKEINFRKKYIFHSETGELKKGVKKDIEEGIEWALEDEDILNS
ncbi:hypothetical protein [uncultured Ilyobacter sp.]|uniref:hypothetical protein n=1 Tax=uncultured Ilyobacter sp. TaxID=544433 RepID=UPI0029BFB58C|nr:hypothetical protein [uncultured Ilyobacter sp.]